MRSLTLAIVAFALFSFPLAAATSVEAPTDAQLVDRSDAIVSGTVLSATGIEGERGMISTRYRFLVDETIKGALLAGSTVDIVELGGSLGDRFLLVPGSAVYAPGEHALAFLRRGSNSTFYTANMTFGHLRFAEGDALIREAICTIDEHEHVSAPLPAAEYVRWVKESLKGVVAPLPMRTAALERSFVPQANANTASQFCLIVTDVANVTKPVRWPGCENPAAACPTISLQYNNLQGSVDVNLAVSKAAAAWTNEPAAAIKLSNGGTTAISTLTPDAINAVDFSSSQSDFPSSWCDAGNGCALIYGNGGNTFNGESFHSIVEMDILVKPGAFSQTKVESILTHEFGHGIGLKHAEGWPAPPTSSNASVMLSSFNAGNGALLQDRDREAVATVYGSGLCFPVAISSVTGNRTVTPGDTVQLSVIATGSNLTYQWYAGSSGNTSTLVATTAGYVTPPITAVRTYWVRVSNSCGSPQDSATITLTPAQCNAPAFTQNLSSQTITANTSVPLQVVVAGSATLTYQWYQGAAGVTTTPVGTNSNAFTTPPLTTTTSYWVRVANSCGTIDSAVAVLTVPGTCTAPVLTGPGNATSSINSSLTLLVVAAGQGPFAYQWYEGTAPDTTKPIAGATADRLNLGPFSTSGATKYWVRVSNECGPTTSSTATVTISCSTPAIPTLGAPQAIETAIDFNAYFTDTNATIFELQESTNPDFTNPATFAVTGATQFKVAPRPDLTQDTAFYYRVRAIASCDATLKSGYSATSKVVRRAARANDPSFAGTSGMTATMTLPYFIAGFPTSGKTALADTFSVTTDQPWVTVVPSSGALPSQGVTVQVKVDGSQVSDGTTMGTLTLIRTQNAQGKDGLATTVPPVSVPVSVSLATPVSPTPRTTTPSAQTLIIPAIAHAAGANQSQFKSDIRLTNTSLGAITYQLSWTPTRSNGTEKGLATQLTVAGGDTKALNDIVRDFFGNGFFGENAQGTLEIKPLSTGGAPSSSRTTVASSRTFNVASNGTFGQFIPAIPFGSFIGSLTSNANAKISLQQIASSAAYRTNLGFVEGSGEGASVLARLFDIAGNVVKEARFDLQPFEHRQDNMATVFNLGSQQLSDGRVEVQVTSTGGKVSAYASVLDNKTSDPLLVFPVQPSEIAASRFVAPGIAELDNGSSNFHSDMRVYNASASPVVVTLSYNPQPGSAPAADSKTRTIGPNEVLAIDNVLPTLWNLTGGGAVSVSAANDAPVVVTARTYSRQADGGTYGQFIPAVNSRQAVGLNEAALEVVQLEESTAFRSNLGLVEVTGNAVEVELLVYRPESKFAVRVVQPLEANQFIQLSQIFKRVNLGTVYNGRVSVKVLSGNGRISAYGSIVDNRTLDPTYVPAQ